MLGDRPRKVGDFIPEAVLIYDQLVITFALAKLGLRLVIVTRDSLILDIGQPLAAISSLFDNTPRRSRFRTRLGLGCVRGSGLRVCLSRLGLFLGILLDFDRMSPFFRFFGRDIDFSRVIVTMSLVCHGNCCPDLDLFLSSDQIRDLSIVPLQC